MFRTLPLQRAIVWSLLGGYLLLPPRTDIDLPLVPDFNKTTIPNLCALALCILIARRRVQIWPKHRVMQALLVLFVFGTIATVLTNREPLIFSSIRDAGPIHIVDAQLPGLRLLDMLSILSEQMIVLIPFILGRAFLSSESGLREMLLALFIGGLLYSVPALFEVRLSPQLNTWIYGFFQHDFQQMMRGSGFRPLVFLPHALWLAFFMMSAAVSAAALARTAERGLRARYLAALLYLFCVLVLCKSLAPMLYALTLVPLLLFSGVKLQIRLAVLLGAAATLYPMLRDYQLVPTGLLLDWAEAINPDRAQSLGFRFGNEERILERANEKWLFGWGGWGRNLVRNPETGEIATIPDGEWIIAFSTYGWVGYVSMMGLLGGPLFLLWRAMRKLEVSRYAAALAMLLAITMVDMLINAILTPFTWLTAGALLGYCEAQRKASEPARAPPPKRLRPVL
ncbi:MAG: hypothetical protein RIG84_05290 [Roseovarius sp.]